MIKKIITVYGTDNCGKNTLIRLLENSPNISCSMLKSFGSPKFDIMDCYTDLGISIKDAHQIYVNQLTHKDECSIDENYINYAFLAGVKERAVLSKSTGIHHPSETLSKDINVLYKKYELKQVNVSRNIIVAFFATFLEYIEEGEGTFSKVLKSYVKELVDDADKFEYARENFLNIEHTDLINPDKRDSILSSLYTYIEEDNKPFGTEYNEFNTRSSDFITLYEKSLLDRASKTHKLVDCYTKISTAVLKEFPDTEVIPYEDVYKV